MFYKSIFELEETQPDAALLRILTVKSELATDRPLFPGEAIFNPILNRKQPLVKALVDRGIDLTATNPDGQTALHLATGVGDVLVMEMLLEAGSDVNAAGMGGATPLHCAAETRQLDVAQLLLEYGADVGAKDESGETALQYAEESGAADIVALLKAEEVNPQAISSMEPADQAEHGNQDDQTTPLAGAENIVTHKPPRKFVSELAVSCKEPIGIAEWVGEVDRELISMISDTIDRINALPDMKWDDVIFELDKNNDLETVGDPIYKTKLFSIDSKKSHVRTTVLCSIPRNDANDVLFQIKSPLRRFIGDDDIFQTLNIYELWGDDDFDFYFDFSENVVMGNTVLPLDIRWCKQAGLQGHNITGLLRYPTGAKPHFMVCRTFTRARFLNLTYLYHRRYSGLKFMCQGCLTVYILASIDNTRSQQVRRTPIAKLHMRTNSHDNYRTPRPSVPTISSDSQRTLEHAASCIKTVEKDAESHPGPSWRQCGGVVRFSLASHNGNTG